MEPLNYFLSASVSVPLIHPHNRLFKLSFYSAIPESPRADCPLVLFTVCFKQELLCLANLPPSTRDNDLLSLLRFLFLLDGNGFWLGANVYCVLLNSANLDTGSLVIQMRNHWVLGLVVVGTVRPVTQSGLLFEHQLCQIFVSSSKFKVNFSALMSIKITND